MKFNLRLLYLYLFSFVGLLITVIGSIQMVDLALKKYVFKVNDYFGGPAFPVTDEKGKVIQSVEEVKMQQELESNNQTKRNFSTAISMITIGAPLYLYHWKTIKKESKEK